MFPLAVCLCLPAAGADAPPQDMLASMVRPAAPRVMPAALAGRPKARKIAPVHTALTVPVRWSPPAPSYQAVPMYQTAPMYYYAAPATYQAAPAGMVCGPAGCSRPAGFSLFGGGFR